MKANILKNEAKELVVELEGEEHSLPNVLREIILEDDDVEFAAYTLDHPEIGKPRIIVKTDRKKAMSVFKEAVKKLDKRLEELKNALKKAKAK